MRLPACKKARWRQFLRAVLLLFVAHMNVFANSLGHPGNHSFAAMLEMRIAATPVVVEFLSLSQFSHDAALVSYVQKFPGNLWPELQPESHNLLYVLWSPLHDRVYAGRTVNLSVGIQTTATAFIARLRRDKSQRITYSARVPETRFLQ